MNDPVIKRSRFSGRQHRHARWRNETKRNDKSGDRNQNHGKENFDLNFRCKRKKILLWRLRDVSLSVCPVVCFSICPFVCLSDCPFVHLSADYSFLSICLYNYLPIYIIAEFFLITFAVCKCVCLFVHSVIFYWSMWLFIGLLVSLFVDKSICCKFIQLNVCQTVCSYD